MSYFNDLRFLDLDDVSKEEADEINNILYSTRLVRSVELPWLEDHVDWSQQSSYGMITYYPADWLYLRHPEGETSECSESGGDCYQATGPPMAVPVPTSIHQVYPPPQQVVPTVQLSYLPPTGYQHYPLSVYDGGRPRRNKASPKRSGSGAGGSNVGTMPSSTVAQGSQTPGTSPGTTVAPPYPSLAPYSYHHPLVPAPPPTQYGYMGTGMGPAQHATGHPLFLTPQIPVYPAPPPHMYTQYPHQPPVYGPGLQQQQHNAPSGPQERSPKSEESGVGGATSSNPATPIPPPQHPQQPPLHPQANDIDVGMGGGRAPAVHMVAMQQQGPPPGDHPVVPTPPPARPTSATTPTNTTVDTDAKVAEVQESVSRAAPVPVPTQAKSLPPQNAIKTTSLPPSSAIKANPVKPGAVSMRKPEDSQTGGDVQAAPATAAHSGSSTPAPATSTAPAVALGSTQPQAASPGPTPAQSVPPQPATVPPPPASLPLPAGPPVLIPPKPTWAGLFKSSPAPPPASSGLPPLVSPLQSQAPLPSINTNNPTVAESMLGGNKGVPKSKGPPPLNAVVLTPPPAHLVAPAVHHSGHHGAASPSTQHQQLNDKSAATAPAGSKVQAPGQSVANSQDPTLTRIAEVLSGYELEHRAVVLTPRGLNNPSNYCYINATLQALLACAPFYNLIKTLAKIKPPPSSSSSNSVDAAKSPTPVIDSMIQFVSEFSAAPSASRLRKERSEKAQARKEGGGVDPDLGVLPGVSFEPIYVYKMVHSSSTFLQLEGRQEDAEEFLTVLLNGLNDEMTELLKLKGTGLSNGEVTTNGDSHADVDSDWKEVMNKGISRVTRRTEVGKTPLTEIFMGQIRSRVARSDPQLSTDNIQPFYSLQLDVENCSTLEEALDKMTSEKAVEGGKVDEKTYTSSYIDQLPVVLILHLKCFYYSHGRPTKIAKSPDFPIDLKLEPKLLQPNKSKQFAKTTSYKLFAVVYHEGKEATKGHYLADVYHVGSSTWIRYDDAQVKAVSEQHVLNPKPPRVPYLLLYRRMDKTNSKP